MIMLWFFVLTCTLVPSALNTFDLESDRGSGSGVNQGSTADRKEPEDIDVPNSLKSSEIDAVNHQNAADYQAKNTLAQSAAGESEAAQAALAEKQIILQQLEQQFRDAQQGLMGKRAKLMQAQRAAESTNRAAQKARTRVNVLQEKLNVAQAAAAHHVTRAASRRR